MYFFLWGGGGGRGKQGEFGRSANGDRVISLTHVCKVIGTKESIYIRIEFKYHRIGLEYQHGRRFIVLEHQYRHRDVMETLYSSEF